MRILLAEDNPVNQTLAVRMLEKWGHKVVVAGNGKEALAAMEKEPFDLVLMDVQMPEMGGLEATAAIREREKRAGGAEGAGYPPKVGEGPDPGAGRGGHIPIIAMTAHAMKGDRERCLEAGMDGYVSKPMQAKELLAAIDRFAQETPTQLRWVPAHVVGTRNRQTPEPTADSRQPIPTPAVLDRAELLDRVAGDRELLRELVGIFLGESAPLMAAVREAVARRNGPALERAAHSLKGCAGNLGARPAAGEALRLETAARQGDWAQAEAACAALEAAIERLKPALVALADEGEVETETAESAGANPSLSAAPSPHLPPGVAPLLSPSPRPAVLDRAELLRRVGGDVNLLKELIALFLESYPGRMSDLREAVQRRDSSALERAAHAMKGSVGTFSAAAAVEAARGLEEMGRAGDLAGAEAALVNLEVEIERLMPALRALGSEES